MGFFNLFSSVDNKIILFDYKNLYAIRYAFKLRIQRRIRWIWMSYFIKQKSVNFYRCEPYTMWQIHPLTSDI